MADEKTRVVARFAVKPMAAEPPTVQRVRAV